MDVARGNEGDLPEIVWRFRTDLSLFEALQWASGARARSCGRAPVTIFFLGIGFESDFPRISVPARVAVGWPNRLSPAILGGFMCQKSLS